MFKQNSKLNRFFGRKDKRSNFCFSIDDKNAKTLDDVISVENICDGACRVGIHISDVSEFIKKNGSVDKEAALRV